MFSAMGVLFSALISTSCEGKFNNTPLEMNSWISTNNMFFAHDLEVFLQYLVSHSFYNTYLTKSNSFYCYGLDFLKKSQS